MTELKGVIIFYLIIALAFGIPIFLFGMTAVIGVFSLMFSPVTQGSIPVWAIFVVMFFVILIMNRRKTAKLRAAGY